MAQSWRAVETTKVSGAITQANLTYSFRSTASGISYLVNSPELGSITASVDRIVGGTRHGLSLLARINNIGGEQLARPVLIETRYLFSTPHQKLELSPGFSKEQPQSWETALGRVLAPSFEKRCLTCHGARLSGVRCEDCHTQGPKHAVNPAKLSNPERIQICANCHADARPLADPMPGDLLISHQVEALTNSECYRQSEAGLTCSTCHNPHKDEATTVARSEKACISCHACAANQKSGCVGCHMPTTQKDTFKMVDHWIRVTPAGNGHKTAHLPKRAFLRIIALDERAQAAEVEKQLVAGAPFFDLARKYSTGPSALSGGYLGGVELSRIDPALAAAAGRLGYGEFTDVIETAGHFAIVQRMPRDFRWRANDIYREAEELKAKGEAQQAADKCLQALQIYPQFLRALVLLGSIMGEQGNAARAVAILEHANRLYPEDAGALFNLGIAYGAAGRSDDEIRTYERAIAIDPDLTPALLNLGAVHFGAGKWEAAAEAFERGLQTNPLSARLYYNLSLVREKQGRANDARRLLRVAAKIAPGQY